MEKLKQNAGLVSLILLVAFIGYAFVAGVPVKQDGALGIKQSASKFTNVEVTNELQTGVLTVTGNSNLSGNLALTGELNNKMALTSVTASSTATVTTTLTTAMSGETFYIAGTTSTFILPATSTASGSFYRFVVGGAMTGDATIVTSDGGNNIEGSLIVAGAVIDCDAEDTLTFVADGENIGDFVELYSDGTYWYIGSSGALTGSKLTCTAS